MKCISKHNVQLAITYFPGLTPNDVKFSNLSQILTLEELHTKQREEMQA